MRARPAKTSVQMSFDTPARGDGAAITRLIRACPPLDANSPYAYLILCEHFSATCAIARRGHDVVGFVSAYLVPGDPGRLFVWQVAVDLSARGAGIASRMLDHLWARPACASAVTLEATIGPSNTASDRLFRAFAKRHRLALERDLLFSSLRHFPDRGHSDEFLYRIGPRSLHRVRKEA